MASEVDICNLALMRAGITSTIANLDEGSSESIACKELYAQTRDTVLSAFSWPFAVARHPLATRANITPPAGWAYAYAVPDGCLVMRRITRTGVASSLVTDRIPFEVAGANIYANGTGLEMVYTQRVTDPTLFPPKFISLLGWALASELVLALQGKVDVAGNLRGAYQQELKAIEDDPFPGYCEPEVGGELAICALALQRAGMGGSITALNQTSEVARIARLTYVQVRDGLLREYPWPFATARATLVASADAPPTNWGYAYTLPVDCLRARGITITGLRIPPVESRIPFEVVGSKVFTDASPAELVYTAKIVDHAAFDLHFRSALAWALAAEFVMALSAPENLVKAIQAAGMFRQACTHECSVAWSSSMAEQSDNLPMCEMLQARL